ncbi:DUF2339 domain-containing protein [Mycolicibacterium sp. XJ1819]
MTEPHRAVIARLYADLAELDRLLSGHQPAPYWPPPPPPPPPAPLAPTKPSSDHGWIGKLLAVAGVAVTLVGVVLLLVLAAQAGILRPEVRVAAGVVLAVGLVGAGGWLSGRPGGRVGAIALAATGVAAGYMDVIAVTTIYHWLSAPLGLLAAAVIGGGGLMLARRWNSEHLGVLVLVPLIVLAPIVVGGVTLLLVSFMLALSAASLPVQLGRDWPWLHSARIAATTVPLITALIAVHHGDGRDALLAAACVIAAGLAVTAALILLRDTGNRVLLALLTGAGLLPVLCVALVADRVPAALMAAALSAVLLGIVLTGDRWPGVDKGVRAVWSAMSAVSAVIAVLVACKGHVAGPVLLAAAVVIAVAARRAPVARWISRGFAVVGALFYLGYAPPWTLVEATALSTAAAISTLIASLLLIAFAGVTVWTPAGRDPVVWVCAAVTVVYAVTTFAVTAGVAIAGEGGGFFAGHTAATICWIGLAAAAFGHAARLSRVDRSVPIGGGLALVVAATAKLFLFDLGTLDGIFRVLVFIVVGLALLGMGAGYARLLDRQDQQLQPRP